MSRRGGRLSRLLAAWSTQTAGAAAVELAILMPLLTFATLNIIDVATYAYDRMQLQNAAQMGAEAAWAACNENTPSSLPATNTSACPNFSTAVSRAITKTMLGSNVTLAAGSPTEGYYCTTTTGALQLVGTGPGTVGSPPTKPTPDTCAAVAGASDLTAAPGDYVNINVSYTYTPIFSGVSVAGLLGSNVTQTVWMRLGE
jgi:Flp pilus assembly protein TadG